MTGPSASKPTGFRSALIPKGATAASSLAAGTAVVDEMADGPIRSGGSVSNPFQ